MEQNIQVVSKTAGEDLSAALYRMVSVSGNDAVSLCDDTTIPYGVVYVGAVEGSAVAVVTSGDVELYVDEATGLAAGAEFACGANGGAVAAGYEAYVAGVVVKGAAQNARAIVAFGALAYKTGADPSP